MYSLILYMEFSFYRPKTRLATIYWVLHQFSGYKSWMEHSSCLSEAHERETDSSANNQSSVCHAATFSTQLLRLNLVETSRDLIHSLSLPYFFFFNKLSFLTWHLGHYRPKSHRQHAYSCLSAHVGIFLGMYPLPGHRVWNFQL